MGLGGLIQSVKNEFYLIKYQLYTPKIKRSEYLYGIVYEIPDEVNHVPPSAKLLYLRKTTKKILDDIVTTQDNRIKTIREVYEEISKTRKSLYSVNLSYNLKFLIKVPDNYLNTVKELVKERGGVTHLIELTPY